MKTELDKRSVTTGHFVEYKSGEWAKDGERKTEFFPHVERYVGGVTKERYEQINEAVKALLDGALAKPSPTHSTEENYQHFLSYSGLAHSDLLRYTYFHGADDPNAPSAPASSSLARSDSLVKDIPNEKTIAFFRDEYAIVPRPGIGVEFSNPDAIFKAICDMALASSAAAPSVGTRKKTPAIFCPEGLACAAKHLARQYIEDCPRKECPGRALAPAATAMPDVPTPARGLSSTIKWGEIQAAKAMPDSPTPRTDACLRNAPKHILAQPGQQILVTPAPQLLDLARQLERELAGLQAMYRAACKLVEESIPAPSATTRDECKYPEECKKLGKCIRPDDHDSPPPCHPYAAPTTALAEFRELVAWAWTALERLPESRKFNANVVRRADAALRAATLTAGQQEGPLRGLLESLADLECERDGGWSSAACSHLRRAQTFSAMLIEQWKKWAEYANAEYRKATGRDIPQEST